jgi:hypothetical protein
MIYLFLFFLKNDLTLNSIISINLEFKNKRTKFKITTAGHKETHQVNIWIDFFLNSKFILF